MKKTIITLSQEAITKLAGYAKEINEYDDEQYNYDVGIWLDGTVNRGDLHISCNSWTEWHDRPAIQVNIKAMYTDDYLQDCFDEENARNPIDPESEEYKIKFEEERKAWREEANGAAEAWAEDIAEQLAEGVDLNKWKAPKPQIEW